MYVSRLDRIHFLRWFCFFMSLVFTQLLHLFPANAGSVQIIIWFINRNISNADISIETYGGLSSFIVFNTQNLQKGYPYCGGELRTAVNTMTIDCTWRIRLNHNDSRIHSSGSLDEPEYLEVWPGLTSLNTFLYRYIKCSRFWKGILFAS